MSGLSVNKESLERLRVAWITWSGIVQRFADQGCARHDIGSLSYQSLHTELQSRIRHSQQAQTLDAEDLRQMQELSEPWVNVESLASADRKLLQDLTGRCAALHPLWTGTVHRRKPSRQGRSRVVLLTVIMTGLIGFVVWHRLAGGPFPDTGLDLMVWARTIRRHQPLVHTAFLVLGTTVAVVLVTWLVFRPPGRY